MGLYIHGGTPKWMVNLVSFMENPIKKWMISNYPLSTGMCRVVLSSTKGFAQRLGPRDPRIDWPSFAGCPVTYPKNCWTQSPLVSDLFLGGLLSPKLYLRSIPSPHQKPGSVRAEVSKISNKAIPNSSSGGFLK